MTPFQEEFKFLKSCCLVTSLEPEDVLEPVHWIRSIPDEEEGAAVFLAKSNWFTLEESQDYSGHGCQCGASVSGPYDTMLEAIRFGLTKSARKVLSLRLEDLDGKED